MDKKKEENIESNYVSKFRISVYAFFLFILFSNKVSYKILDIILKVFTNNLEVIDENECPLILGTFIFALFIAFILLFF